MNNIVAFPVGALDSKSKERLTNAGIIWIECDDPAKIVTVIPGAPLVSADDMLMSAMHAIKQSGSHSTAYSLVAELTRRLVTNQAKP